MTKSALKELLSKTTVFEGKQADSFYAESLNILRNKDTSLWGDLLPALDKKYGVIEVNGTFRKLI